AFRLLSATRPPRIMYLEPKPLQAIKVQEPPCEDDKVEARIRRERAAVAAVDFSWILSQSRMPYMARKEKTTTVFVTLPTLPSVSLVLLERVRRPVLYPHPLLRSSSPKPSPHENSVKEDCCTRVAFEWTGAAHMPAASKRKKRRVH
ncbi:hypothetical protein OF83DRAFT_1157729, partial [Amylostereum chailletii]